MSPLEFVAVAITLAAVYLTTRQVVWCWPLGMISVALYAVVFYDAQLYAEVGLQAVYFVLSAYGWWAWVGGGAEESGLSVRPLGIGHAAWLIVAGAVGGALLGFGLARLTTASLPFLDSQLAAFSIVAQWLQARKLLQAWLLWIALDVVYVGMFAYKGLYLTSALYAVFLYLAALGYRSWSDSMRAEAAGS
ncbi:MAG: nicotinamide riboside transporter PnuC [Acidobacteria bacterium]|nr:nicotinamide riboside transporter PnuC [Acidobacteriota bacterium]